MHEPVLLKEVIQFLQIKPQGRYVDGTLGGGGHSVAILQKLGPDGRLLSLEADPVQLEKAKSRLQPFGDQTKTRLVNFQGLQGVLDEIGWTDVDGMIFDLGISSDQLEDPRRGFSFQATGPLDMRLSPEQGETALSLLKKMDEDQLAQVFHDFGQFRGARKLSRAILNEAAEGRLTTTHDLALLCERILHREGRTHPATRVFLALRCLVNEELKALQTILEVAPNFLAVGGRLLFISFHSLEDRLVKNRFRFLAKEGLSGRSFVQVTRKPVVPQEEEAHRNPRSRSAKLRVLERTG